MPEGPEDYKQAAAQRALGYVEDGMIVGLGSGSTAQYLVRGLGERLRTGRLRDVVGVPTSEATARLARELEIPLATLDQRPELDLAIDGADEVDPELNLIKGLGGALLREKIVAACARRLVIIVDESKRVDRLGQRAPLPVEVVAFGQVPVERRVVELGGRAALRRDARDAPFETDEGHRILDCRFASIEPATLDVALRRIPGVVEHGLFVNMASVVVVAGAAGVTILDRA